MVRKGCGFSLPCFIIPFKLGAWKRQNNKVWAEGHREKVSEKQKSFCLLSSRIKPATLSIKVITFLLPCMAEIEDLPIQRIYSQTDLDKRFVSFIKHPWNRRYNMETWTKSSCSRSNWITVSDSDHTCHICFL